MATIDYSWDRNAEEVRGRISWWKIHLNSVHLRLLPQYVPVLGGLSRFYGSSCFSRLLPFERGGDGFPIFLKFPFGPPINMKFRWPVGGVEF